MSTKLPHYSYYVFRIRTDRRGIRIERFVGRVDGTSDVNARENALSKFQLSLDSDLRVERRESDPNMSVLQALQTLRDAAMDPGFNGVYRDVCSNGGNVWNR